jgi:hypothetical protein
MLRRAPDSEVSQLKSMGFAEWRCRLAVLHWSSPHEAKKINIPRTPTR